MEFLPGKNCHALILAAGKGTRMHSDRPKVLQTLLGEPMLAYVMEALKPLFDSRIMVVAGHKAEMLAAAFPAARMVIQHEQLGTGHALMAAMAELKKCGAEYATVINGDVPLITTKVLENFLVHAKGCDIAFATVTLDDPGTYGRVTRRNGKVSAIVEARDYREETHGEPTGEVNAGLYLLRLEAIKPLLPLLRTGNNSGEYYLTDLVALGCGAKLDVRGIESGRDPCLLGVNSPYELAEMEELLRQDIVRNLMQKGVLVHSPALLRAGPRAVIEPGAEITGPCEIYGQSRICRGAMLESHCVVINSVIEENAHVRSFCHLEGANVGPQATVGPYARLRPGAMLEAGAHVGNFVELKKTRLGKGSKANHLTYLGDAEVGMGVNIGAGTITCNYDGQNKFSTTIGDGAFIGSNTSLVAPVEIGSGALVGAGSVITKNVPAGELGIARERQKNLPRKIK